MFNLKLQPIAPGGLGAVQFTVEVAGSTLLVNGQPFDFGAMPPGSRLPFTAVRAGRDNPEKPAPWIYPEDVVCDEDGVVNIRLFVPMRDPSSPLEPIVRPPDGVVINLALESLESPRLESTDGQH